MLAYAVFYKKHERDPLNEMDILMGIFSDKLNALKAARRVIKGDEDESWIIMQTIDTGEKNDLIWHNTCDEHYSEEQYYCHFWPEGIPDPE